MAISKLSIYNDALVHLGQRRLSTDTEDRGPRYDLDNLYDNNGVDYCLEVVKPRFASKVVTSTGAAPTLVTQYAYQHDLPSDFIVLGEDKDGNQTVYQDGKLETAVKRFYFEGNSILTDFQNIYIRYIQDFATVGLTKMKPSFGRVVSAYFARELAWKYDPDAEDRIQALLDARVEIARAQDGTLEPDTKGFAPDTLTQDWLEVYNDALQIMKLPPMVSLTDDSVAKNRLSLALDSKLVDAVLEDTQWQFGLKTDQVFYDPNITPAFGYKYACAVPTDCHRINGVYLDDHGRNPLRNYIDEEDPPGGTRYIFSGASVIYVEYVSSDWLTTPQHWPAYFRRMVAARMAVDANVPGKDEVNAEKQYATRRREAMSTDAIQSPPKTLTEGSWSRSRGSFRSRRDRP